MLSLAHKASFVLWFGAMAIHVLGHFLETPRLAGADYGRRVAAVPGAARYAASCWSAVLVSGVLLGDLVDLVDRHGLASFTAGG